MIPCEIDIKSTPFNDTTIITHEIELPPSGNKVGFKLWDGEYFIIKYITDTTPNSSAGHQILTQDEQNVWIIAINGEEPIIDQGELD